jgi:DNA-binding response OmpR family regulator
METPGSPDALVIDSDPSIRELIAAVLRRRGLRADTAADSDAALHCMHAHRYGAVVLDPRMPGGDVLLTELSSSTGDGKPNIIIATSPDSFSRTLARRAGVQVVLAKPFDLDDLSAAVAACLDPRSSRS